MHSKIMVIVFGLLISPMTFGKQINVEWERGAGGADPDGYAVFHRDHQRTYDYSDALWEGEATACVVNVPDDRQTAFVVRAYTLGAYDLDGNRTQYWSGDSNEAVYTPAAPELPSKPKSLVVRILTAVVNFFKNIFWV